MRTTRVFGPAYLDRVRRVDRPLLDAGVVDDSYEGWPDSSIGRDRIVDDAGHAILIRRGSGPVAEEGIRIRGLLEASPRPWLREVVETSDRADLGGMGAGFAAALGGELISALGSTGGGELDTKGAWVKHRLADLGVAHRPILMPGRETDGTWIVTSGPFGDKLAIGFRGCHSAVTSLAPADPSRACDLLVVAGFSNRLMAEALAVPSAVRLLAPAMRNVRDVEPPLAGLAGRCDVLACNRREWDALADRGRFLEATPLVSVTDGPAGCRLSFRDREGRATSLQLPAFPREAPPRDTNRAGEAFASTLVATLLEAGWHPGPADPATIRHAAERASAAAALVLDLEGFGFPSAYDVDAAVRAGRVAKGRG